MVFRTQIDKMDRSAKVLCSLSFLIGFWHHSNTFRFAVVLFLQIEGECEREMGGNPLPLPPYLR